MQCIHIFILIYMYIHTLVTSAGAVYSNSVRAGKVIIKRFSALVLRTSVYIQYTHVYICVYIKKVNNIRCTYINIRNE